MILIGTGSEVQLAVDRPASGWRPRAPRPGSCRCRARSGSTEQDAAYRQPVLPTGVKARVSVEAGIAMSWRDLVGDCGESVSIEHYGASAPHKVLFEQFGFTADKVVAAAHASLATGRRHHRHHDRQLRRS